MSSPVQSVTGYFTSSDGFRHAVGLDGDGCVRETFFSPSAGEGNDLLAVYSTAAALSGFFTDDDGRQHVIVADANGYLSEIHWKPGDIRWYELPIGPFGAVVSISAFYSPDDNYRHVIVATNDGNISEVFYHPSIGVHVSQPPLGQMPGVVSIAGFYTPDDTYRHVIIATNDGNITEIFYHPSIGVHVSRPPLAQMPGVVSIAGFYTSDDSYRHVIVATNDGNIAEIFYHPSIGSHISQPPLTQYSFAAPTLEEIAPQPTTIGAQTAASLSAYGAPSTAGRTLALTGDVVKQYVLSEHAGVWRSLGGSAWQQLANSPVGGWGNPLVADPSDSSHVIFGSEAGAWETVDGGDNWQAIVRSQAVAAVCFSADGSLIMATRTNVSRRDVTTGQVSIVLTTGDQITAVAIGGTYAFARSATAIWFSTDGGLNWSPRHAIAQNITFAWNELACLAAVDRFAYLVFGKPGQPGGCGRENWLAVYDAAGDQWHTQPVQITGAAGNLVTTCDGTGLTQGFTRFVRAYILSDQGLAAAVGSRWQLFFGGGEEVCQALGANTDGTVSQWRRVVGATGPGLPNTDPVHADIWGFHLDLSGRNGWVVGDGGVFADFPGPGADWSTRHWRLQSHSLRTHTATRLVVLPTVPAERSRLVYSTGDNDYWWRDATPHAFPVAGWESPAAVGDANWCTGDVGSPAIAVVCGHNVHQVALTTFDQPVPPGSAFSPNSALNLTLGDGYDGPYFFHVIQTPTHQQRSTLLDGLMLVNGPLRCLDSSGKLINATNAGGGPLLIRNRAFGSGPDANATKLATWTLESDSLPTGVYGVAASGGPPDPVLYAWSNAGGTVSLYRRATPQDAWNPVAVGGLVAGAVWAAPVFANPFDSSEVLVLTSNGVLQSQDGGGMFAPENSLNNLIGATAAGTVVQMAFNRDNPRELAVATNAGGYFRDSGGAWHDLTPLLPKPATGPITAVAIDAEAVYFSSDGRGVFRVRGHRRA